MQNNLLFTKLNWCHWGLVVTIGMRLTSITLHYTLRCVDSEHCVSATVWMWTITITESSITSNETWRNKPGLGSEGSIAGIAPAYQGQNTEWVTNSGNCYTSSDIHCYEYTIWRREIGKWRAFLRIFANNTRFSRRQLILMPIVYSQDFNKEKGVCDLPED